MTTVRIRRPLIGAGLATFALFATACGGSATPETPAAEPTADQGEVAAVGMDAVCAAGAEEGEVLIRRGSNAEAFAEMVKPFEEKHGIDVKFVSMTPTDNVQRIFALIQTGSELDIDGTDFDIPSAQPLLDEGLIAQVDWSELGIPEDVQLTVGDYTVYRTNRNVLGIGYNTEMISEDEVPSTWDEFLDPKWSGKVIVDPRGIYLSGLSVAWGAEKTIQWYEEFLDAANPVPVEGATASLQKVIAGEVPMSASAHDNEVLEQQATGAPVAIKYLDVVPAQDNYSFIMKDAPHPNAVRCFYGWVGSDEGLAQLFDVEFKSNGTTLEGLTDANELSFAITPEEAEEQSAVAQKLSELTLSH